MITLEKPFFDNIRASLFIHGLKQTQVDGMNAIANAWNGMYMDDDPRWVAYGFATAFHETATTMQPIEEIGRGHGRPYGAPINGHTYYGRGYVQLTWLRNYDALGKIIHVDLVSHPERALEPDIAARIMIEGMRRGSFTGHKLGDFFNDTAYDPVGARRIINSLDCATLIAGYYDDFADALTT